MRTMISLKSNRRLDASAQGSTKTLGYACVLVLIACAPTASRADTPGAIAQVAKDALETFSADPTWLGPTSSPPIAKSKFVVDIPCAQAAIGCSRPGDAFLDAAKKMGWKTQLIDPAGDPNKLQAAVKTAIQQGADGIFLPGGSLAALGSTFQEAKAAGIKMITMAGEGNPVGPDAWDANIYENTVDYGKAYAAYIASKKPNARILIVNDAEFPEIDAQTKSFVSAIKEYCPHCEVVRQIDFSIVNIATTMPQQVKAALQADPSIDWIVGPYDFASQYIVQAVVEIGQGDSVRLISWGGHPQNLKFIRDGQVQSATVAVGEEWQGYAAADQMNRLFNGQPFWKQIIHNTGSQYGSENYAEQIIDKSNLPSNIDVYWNSKVDFKGMYLKLWGLTN
jgi:ABC-type sugar transport system substrate-binding protein